MTAAQSSVADWQDEQIAGIQIAIFEVIWDCRADSWLSEIWFERQGLSLNIHAVTSNIAELPESDWNVFQRQMNEVLDIAVEGQFRTVSYSLCVPGQLPCGVELMSNGIFQEIAKEIAPWRVNPLSESA